jgi:hypothetical protein
MRNMEKLGGEICFLCNRKIKVIPFLQYELCVDCYNHMIHYLYNMKRMLFYAMNHDVPDYYGMTGLAK